MRFFVDANVFVYAATDRESDRADACISVLRSIADGAPGFTSVLVIEELWHLELSGRLGEVNGLARKASQAMGDVIPITECTAAAAIALPSVERLGSADRFHVAVCREHSLEAIVTADRGFDGVSGVRRIDPLDSEALGENGVAVA